MTTDREARIDELTAIESIYGDLVQVESDRRICAKFSDHLQICFALPADYPSKSPPTFEISGPTLTLTQKTAIDSILQMSYEENVGGPVLFVWIDAVLSHLKEMKDEETNSESTEEEKVEIVEINAESPREFEFEIVSSDTLTDRKSVFQAHAARITSKEEAMAVLDKLKENTKIARATHNIYAWIVRKPDFMAHDCDDDGESGAASKILSMLSTMKVENVVVVVSRWYGGIQLGPDRFRHINNIARRVLVDGGFVEVKGPK